ncbi:MAG: D-2-hydroxyacid dehydrogenase [Proteobacteria bacterium]|nr:D-2-hydroxyacid dehydrogenase [Pseudomonadota bacterium]MDE3208671.1 D-2-hydroxyacid dehydrogenase [Pseudomonadota bacterium]
MAKHHIVFLDRSTLDARVRKPNFDHTYTEYQVTTVDQIVERLKDATIAIVNKVPMREEVLKQLPNLKMIAVAATGTDIVDKKYCKAHDIIISNIRNYAVNTVPEHTFSLIFALRRALIAYHEDVRRGRWAEVDQFCFFDHKIQDLAGSVLGIVGYGSLGRSVAKIARALDMKVLYTDHFPVEGMVDLDRILNESDIVTLHCPLTETTKNMIGERQLKMMKKSSILINTARGGLVDEFALAEALKNGEIAGAGFDVLTVEPPKQGNVLLDLKIPNLIITPHVAWASQQAMQTLSDMMVDNIEAYAVGSPINVVE